MKLNYWLSFALLLLGVYPSYSQNRNSIWCFGDSAGIDFTIPTNPQPYYSAMRSRGTAVSIADSVGNLLFYAHTGDTSNNSSNMMGNIISNNHQLMDNGDSIIGISWYQEMVIVPFPDDNNKYYLFSLDITDFYGIYYSIIDMSLNNGLGSVIQKNSVLSSGVRMGDCISTIRHGNGRDWWLYTRSGDGSLAMNPFSTYKINPAGINIDQLQNFMPFTAGSFIEFRWNKQGTKMAFVNYSGLIQVFDYDRCTGLFSNPATIDTMRVSPPLPGYVCAEFSADSRYLYVSSNSLNSFLYQYDLINLPTTFSRTTVWSTTFPVNTAGDLKRGPDDKIYFTCAYIDSMNNWNYPYPDSVYNSYNMNLSVINQPDSAFPACDFQPYSFYLGGKRTYWGLPNNPDYELGAWVGSPCDTLTTNLIPNPGETSPSEASGAWMQAWYNHEWNMIHVNAAQLKGKKGVLRLFDMEGRIVFEKLAEVIAGGYYTTEINMEDLANGVYIVNLVTEQDKISGKVGKY